MLSVADLQLFCFRCEAAESLDADGWGVVNDFSFVTKTAVNFFPPPARATRPTHREHLHGFGGPEAGGTGEAELERMHIWDEEHGQRIRDRDGDHGDRGAHDDFADDD